jgi:hypothetical protein
MHMKDAIKFALAVLMPLALARPGYFIVAIAMFLGFLICVGYFALMATALSPGLFPAAGGAAWSELCEWVS